MMLNTRLGLVVSLGLVVAACSRSQASPLSDPPAQTAAFPSTAAPAENVASVLPPAVMTAPIDTERYPWLADTSLSSPEAVDSLEERFPTPSDYARVAVARDSFGAWLRRLPLAASGTAVKSYRGAVVHTAAHANIAAVAALDVGTGDLQQCADSIIRLHAEWKWSQGRRDISYRAAAGTMLPLGRWEKGERIVGSATTVGWKPGGKASKADHPEFRRYLDAVFGWANTGSLAQQGAKVSLDELRPGDFFIIPGGPGHTVLVLDMARAEDGRRVVLLGQGYMPAQSFHVIRPDKNSAWFVVDPKAEGIKTPFWDAPFTWDTLRRLE